jgi:RNA polymerase sigma-70 factor (ECF subfamily)
MMRRGAPVARTWTAPPRSQSWAIVPESLSSWAANGHLGRRHTVNTVTDEFEAHRDHVFGVAYRLLGSRADAEDAVQEAYLRYAGTDRTAIRDLRAWLTTTTGRLCLDLLRSARVRREAYVGQWLPEPLVERLPATGAGADPAAEVTQRAAVSLALLVVLETLSPEQRVAFVLHDVFAMPFDAVAQALATTPAAARQLASRARRAVAEGRPRHSATPAEAQAVLNAFLRAVAGGDIGQLLELLAPDVVAIGDSNGVVPAARTPITGALRVARFLLGLFRRTAQEANLTTEVVLVNGSPGLLISYGIPATPAVIALGVADGRITGIFNQLNPDKLRKLP